MVNVSFLHITELKVMELPTKGKILKLERWGEAENHKNHIYNANILVRVCM